MKDYKYLKQLDDNFRKGNIKFHIGRNTYKAEMIEIASRKTGRKRGKEIVGISIYFQGMEGGFDVSMESLKYIYQNEEYIFSIRTDNLNGIVTFGPHKEISQNLISAHETEIIPEGLPRERKRNVYVAGSGDVKGKDIFLVNEIAAFDTRWGGWYDNGKFESYLIRIREKKGVENSMGFEGSNTESILHDYSMSKYIGITRARMN